LSLTKKEEMNGEEIIGIIYIIAFFIYLIISVYGGFRTGFRVGAVIPTIIFSVIRVIDGALSIAAYTVPTPNFELYYWSYSLGSIGFAILMGGYIRLLALFYKDQLRQSLRLSQLLNLVGFILGIVGASEENLLFLKIAVALYTAAFVFGTVILVAGYRSADRLWWSIATLVPFMAVRLGYSWYGSFQFSIDPSFVLHLILGVLMEIILIGIFIYIDFRSLDPKKSSVNNSSRV
jgi:hypothetical protein